MSMLQAALATAILAPEPKPRPKQPRTFVETPYEHLIDEDGKPRAKFAEALVLVTHETDDLSHEHRKLARLLSGRYWLIGSDHGGAVYRQEDFVAYSRSLFCRCVVKRYGKIQI